MNNNNASLWSKDHHTFILYRKPEMSDTEFASANRFFTTTNTRVILFPSTFQVIGRYSVWPNYKELWNDISIQGGTLINTIEQNDFVTDVMNWEHVLSGMTPKTWNRLEDIPEGKFVLKGKWKSRKDKWNTHMYAESRRDAIDVYCRLQEDTFIGVDTIYVREYIPLKTLLIGLNGLPVTEEYRFFVLDGKVLCGGFYWQNYMDDIDEDISYSLSAENVPTSFLNNVISVIGDNIRFYSLDVARTENGNWIVVELNEGQQSGLPVLVSEDCLYKPMRELLCPV